MANKIENESLSFRNTIKPEQVLRNQNPFTQTQRTLILKKRPGNIHNSKRGKVTSAGQHLSSCNLGLETNDPETHDSTHCGTTEPQKEPEPEPNLELTPEPLEHPGTILEPA